MYERHMYFRHIIHNLRGEGYSKIPATVYTSLTEAMELVPAPLVTPTVITYALKRLKMSKYNNVRVRLASKISNGYFKPIVMRKEHFNKFFSLFKQVERVYLRVRRRVCPKRKIFFNYPYLFKRFCQMLGCLHYCRDVTTLHSASARSIQGRLWRAVCVQLNWHWHPDIP
jgi:hypothetical protein